MYVDQGDKAGADAMHRKLMQRPLKFWFGDDEPNQAKAHTQSPLEKERLKKGEVYRWRR